MRKQRGFTLIELAISLGVLSIFTLVLASLMLRTLDTYGQVASDTDTLKQGRDCLSSISREMRESVNVVISNTAAGPLLGSVQDALLLWSARQSDAADRVFTLNAVDHTPQVQSIILFYLNTTPEGITQLIRHQLYYAEDLSAFAPPFVLQPGNPYVGPNIVILDNGGSGAGVAININRSTGAVNGTAPFQPPKVLMNRTMSFDMVDDGINPLEARISCQIVDRNNRTATTRLRTQIDPRNL